MTCFGCNSSDQSRIITPSPKENIPQERQNKVYRHLDKIGLVKIDSSSKCNLKSGFFVLTTVIKDEVILKEIALELADSLKSIIVKDDNCPYPAMSTAYIYMNEAEYTDYDGNWISRCSITPHHPEGDASVAVWRLSKYK